MKPPSIFHRADANSIDVGSGHISLDRDSVRGKHPCILMPPGSCSFSCRCCWDLSGSPHSVPSWTPSPREPLPPTAQSDSYPTLWMTQKNHRAKYMSVHIYTLSSTTVAVGSSTSKHKQHWSLICAHPKLKLIINVYSLHKLNTHTKIHLMWMHPTLNKTIRWSHAQTQQFFRKHK